MKYLQIITVIIFLTLLASPASHGSDVARDDEILRLTQKITELENRIKELETTLEEYREQRRILEETGYGWQNIKNWRRLTTGMSTEEVLSILGEPVKTINGVKTLWYYPDIYRGYVSFDDEGRLTGWQEP